MVNISLPLVVILLFLIPIILFFCFSKKKNPFGLARLLGMVHLFFVVIIAVFIYFGMKKETDTAMVWILLYMIDMPISFLLPSIELLVTKNILDNSMMSNFYIPFIFFGLLGSIQYFFIGATIGWGYRKLRQ